MLYGTGATLEAFETGSGFAVNVDPVLPPPGGVRHGAFRLIWLLVVLPLLGWPLLALLIWTAFPLG